MPDVVRIADVHKEYTTGLTTLSALRGVSANIREAELVAIMGASGSGKSTLLHLVGGLDRPTRGTIEVAGNNLENLSDFERTVFRRRRLGIIFQSYNLVPNLNALENVALPALMDARSAQQTAQRASALLERVGLTQRQHHRPQALSGGEQQRVAIARALINDPVLILADEPTGNLDSHHGGMIWDLLAQLVDTDGRTVLAVTHDAMGAAHADRVIVLKDGQITGEFRPAGKGDGTHVATRYAELAGQPR